MNCVHDKCPGEAVWQPILSLQVSVKSPTINARFGQLSLCEMHKDAAKLTDYITPSSWDRITRYMAECGKPVPKRNLTTLRFDRIGSPEVPDEELPF
jgi:hypothetical protein